jgi:hypothetical protein
MAAAAFHRNGNEDYRHCSTKYTRRPTGNFGNCLVIGADSFGNKLHRPYYTVEQGKNLPGMYSVASSIRRGSPQRGISSQCTALQTDPRSQYCTCSCSRRRFQKLSVSLQDRSCTFHRLDIHPRHTHTVRVADSIRQSMNDNTCYKMARCLNSKRNSGQDYFASTSTLAPPNQPTAHHLGNEGAV